jgi:hypothetical protein
MTIVVYKTTCEIPGESWFVVQYSIAYNFV